jgi:hypothetical protein
MNARVRSKFLAGVFALVVISRASVAQEPAGSPASEASPATAEANPSADPDAIDVPQTKPSAAAPADAGDPSSEPSPVASALPSPAQEDGKTVWIYRDVPIGGAADRRTPSEKVFEPFGYMPGERAKQIKVNPGVPVDPMDGTKGTHIGYQFELAGEKDEWVGVTELVDGNQWGTKAGLNVKKLLHAKPDEKLELRFRAKGSGVVVFKAGGLSAGQFKSTLVPALQVGTGPTTLTADWTDYSIGPIKAKQLTNLVDPFTVAAAAKNNPDTKKVFVFVDDIHIVRAGEASRTASAGSTASPSPR